LPLRPIEDPRFIGDSKQVKRTIRMQDNEPIASELMTEDELVEYLRIPEVSKSKNYRNVIENLKRMHHLPRIHICGKPLYPQEAIKEWVRKKTTNGK
jgi:hypothetical protein